MTNEESGRNIRWPLPPGLPQPVCTAAVEDEENGPRDCGKRSRFIVTRTDGDESYGSGGGTTEACEEHLADAVLGMIDGDENVDAIVTVRWNEPEGGDGG